MPSPASGFFLTPHPRTYLPFNFGVEFEMILGLKPDFAQNVDPDATVSQMRKLHLKFCSDVAKLLTRFGMPCDYFDLGDGGQPDYSKWNAMVDSSLSKKHMRDVFCKSCSNYCTIRYEFVLTTLLLDPIEVVSPLLGADASWSQTIDKFWSVLLSHYRLQRDSTCGFHIHISSMTRNWTLDQLRSMAKAIVFWEPATARCAPLSRQDRFQDFCQSNIKLQVPVADCWSHGPLRGLLQAFNFIDSADANAIVRYVCPDKYRA